MAGNKGLFAGTAGGGYTLPVLVSLGLHGVLVAFVVWGWQSAPAPKQAVTPKYVEATLVTIQPKAKQAAPKQKAKVVDLEARRREQKKREEAARKKRLAKEKAERERLRKLAEEKARQEKLKQEKLAKAERERLEKERQERERLERERQRLQQEAAFADALAEEQELLQAQEDESNAQSYVSQMARRIEQNWSRPPSARKGMKCELRIQLVPTGQVVNVVVLKSSGNSAFDHSAEQAVKRVGRFEELQNMDSQLFEKYFRQLTLIFNPQDLRL